MTRFLIPALFVASFAYAADWPLKSGDTPLTSAELDALAGQTITFYDDGQAKFSAGGAYSYTYASGDSAFGTYSISEDGSVCIAYRNGFSRCDLYVRSGERLILIDQKGDRYPVRSD
ncbi:MULTISPECIES: hypothetical protein [unclassified Ruegeria]|uniref:hypothetical protein n=1 Tax=unclassified Ruegeria TaxID=2625375 RepID=UPI001490C799|nr:MULTISPECIES: hypothetical protein [unclassified Ruegeria]NOD36366.1 hypothetical protein [Ruegeria sp. HKCCD7296]NOE35459.1 hypothetical protein [Ruegeria sp. HKCCD7318]NOE42475.1 hypothetical protein [Ruegeria sp. HKCCD7319]